MIHLSFGSNGEFFLESDKTLEPKDIDIVDELDRRIMTARNESIVVAQAVKGSM